MSLSAFTDELAQVRTKKNEIEKFSTANHSFGQRPLNSCQLCGVALAFFNFYMYNTSVIRNKKYILSNHMDIGVYIP